MADGETPTTNGAAAVPTNVTINGHEYDLKAAMPITLGDWAALDRLGLLAPDGNLKGGFSNSLEMLMFLLRKADPAFERQQILDLPMEAAKDLFAAVQAAEQGVKAQVESPSTPSS